METTNTLTDLLSQIPEEVQSLYQIFIQDFKIERSIVIKHPFWIFFNIGDIKSIQNNEFDVTIVCKNISIILWKSRVDAHIVIYN